jgi:hypothetical protein
MESKLKEPKAPRKTLSGTKSSRNQHTNTKHMKQLSIKVRSVCSRQHAMPSHASHSQHHVTATKHQPRNGSHTPTAIAVVLTHELLFFPQHTQALAVPL